MTGLLRDSLEPTDFADSDHRVGNWYHADFPGTATACRVHMVRTGGHWFQLIAAGIRPAWTTGYISVTDHPNRGRRTSHHIRRTNYVDRSQPT
jgi:hypothetical protein